MRNKKYRPIKLQIMLSTILIVCFPFLFLFDGWEKIAAPFVYVLILVGTIVTFFYGFEVKDDRIIIRHGTTSSYKGFSTNFKRQIILIQDITNIEMEDDGKAIRIDFKNSNETSSYE